MLTFNSLEDVKIFPFIWFCLLTITTKFPSWSFVIIKCWVSLFQKSITLVEANLLLQNYSHLIGARLDSPHANGTLHCSLVGKVLWLTPGFRQSMRDSLPNAGRKDCQKSREGWEAFCISIPPSYTPSP
jgi:hypothetical protein